MQYTSNFIECREETLYMIDKAFYISMQKIENTPEIEKEKLLKLYSTACTLIQLVRNEYFMHHVLNMLII